MDRDVSWKIIVIFIFRYVITSYVFETVHEWEWVNKTHDGVNNCMTEC